MKRKFLILLTYCYVFLLLTSCTSLFGPSEEEQEALREKYIQGVAEENIAFRAQFYENTISYHFEGMTDDEIVKKIEDEKSIILQDWVISYYVDNFGDQTDEPYTAQAIEGTFRNSATSGDELFVKFIVDADDVSMELYEYGDIPVSDELNIDAKTPNGIEYSVEIASPTDTYRKKLAKNYAAFDEYMVAMDSDYQVIIDGWDLLESLGVYHGGYFEILSNIHHEGGLKFSASDDYYSEYSFECNTDYLDIIICSLWMNEGLITDKGWFDILVAD